MLKAFFWLLSLVSIQNPGFFPEFILLTPLLSQSLRSLCSWSFGSPLNMSFMSLSALSLFTLLGLQLVNRLVTFEDKDGLALNYLVSIIECCVFTIIIYVGIHKRYNLISH